MSAINIINARKDLVTVQRVMVFRTVTEKGTVINDDVELVSYREDKYGNNMWSTGKGRYTFLR